MSLLIIRFVGSKDSILAKLMSVTKETIVKLLLGYIKEVRTKSRKIDPSPLTALTQPRLSVPTHRKKIRYFFAKKVQTSASEEPPSLSAEPPSLSAKCLH